MTTVSAREAIVTALKQSDDITSQHYLGSLMSAWRDYCSLFIPEPVRIYYLVDTGPGYFRQFNLEWDLPRLTYSFGKPLTVVKGSVQHVVTDVESGNAMFFLSDGIPNPQANEIALNTMMYIQKERLYAV